MRILLLTFIIVVLLHPVAIADTHMCVVDCGTTCSAASVDSAADDAETGDTVLIPAGTCEWTGTVTVPAGKKLTFIGAGAFDANADKTIIQWKVNHAFNLGSTGSRITRIRFQRLADYTSAKYPIVTIGQGWRIDYCSFLDDNYLTNEMIAIQVYDAGASSSTATGLINNNFIQGRIDISGLLSFTPQATAWTEDSALGTEDAIYIEDNTFYRVNQDEANIVDANRGARYVVRYNNIGTETEVEGYTGGHSQIMAHGIQSDTNRGTKSWEIYGNKFYADKSVSMSPIWPRSGTGIVFFNYANANYSSTNPNSFTYFDDRRCYESFSSWGQCNGSSFIDGNTVGESGYPCRDQIGSGKDSSAFDPNTENPAPAQTREPAYLWQNRLATNIGSVSIVNSCDNWIKEMRDYYTEQLQAFDGTKETVGTDSGVGCGTLAARPATCTTGVAYWATTQSCSDLTGFVGTNPSTPLSGSLYKCVANAWEETASYTPYTYPHPLRSESETSYTVTLSEAGTAGHCTLSRSTGEFTVYDGNTLSVDVTVDNGWKSTWTGTCPATGTTTRTCTPTGNSTMVHTCSQIYLFN